MARIAASPNHHRALLVAVLVAMAMVLGAQESEAQAESCTNQLTNLNVCAPFVVPGADTNPNSACCGALQAVEHDCLCNTLRIISRLPSQCNIAPLTCAN